ncbi:tRNA lysidine(34) synthetase TilS [Candidatus Vidania fulgoroideorum]
MAFSGGIDSNLLLFFYKKFLKSKIHLIYIKHNNSLVNKKICKEISYINKTKIIIKNIKVKNKKIKELGIEAAFRYYRYKKLFKTLKKKQIKYLILGHNNNDLIETFFINLFRGSGLYGLASMKQIQNINQIVVIRPFLKLNRNMLVKKILKNKKILLYQDRSNNNLKIFRNCIRKLLLNFYKINNFEKSINNYIKNAKYSLKIIKSVALKDIQKTLLNINKINKLKIVRRTNLIIYFLRKNKFFLYNKNFIKEILKQIKNKKILVKKRGNIITTKNKKLVLKKMNIIVQKYGGTSLGNKKKINNISKKICKFLKKNTKIIVVVSAMAGYTNKLSNYLKNQNKFSDIILFTGEYISLGILCNYLKKKKKQVDYLTSWQIPIITNRCFSRAKILKIYTKKIYKYFLKYDVIIIPGFQGITKNGEITTIGRGGSDNTAIELAYYLNAKICYIYTDVNGICNKDPKLFKNAKIIKKINEHELIEISSLGAKVFQLDSVINCVKKRVNTVILSSFSKFKTIKKEKKKGTRVIFNNKMNNFSIVFNKVNMLSFVLKKNYSISIIKNITKKNINIDNLCFFNYKKKFFLSFSVERTNRVKINYKYRQKKMIKLSIVGIGLKNYSNNFVKIIALLKNNYIKYYCFTTSEIKISFLIEKKYKQKILKTFDNFKI